MSDCGRGPPVSDGKLRADLQRWFEGHRDTSALSSAYGLRADVTRLAWILKIRGSANNYAEPAVVDIAIDPKILKTRQLQAQARWLLVGIAVIAVLVLLRQVLTPHLSRAEIRTAIVERGAISMQVQAAGVVVPVNERVLISPANSSISAVHQPLGSSVKQGDAILEIDSAQIRLDLARLKDELRLKTLEIAGIRQTQQKALRELQNQVELAAIDLESQKVTLERYKTLYQSNIVSQFDFETTSLNVRKLELQLQQLRQRVADTVAVDTNELEQREIEKQLLGQQLVQREQMLRDATVRASSDGIITVLMSELGQNVVAGAELARISDLSSYRVDATLSDFYLHQIAVGMPVTVDLGTGSLKGHLSQILPAVDNGTLRLQVELDEPGNAQLKPNLRVEAGIVTEFREEGLRVTNGIVFNGSGLQNVFVVKDGKAVKRQVDVGLQNASYVEIVDGLAEGDEIIISDMTDYQHLDQITITD